MMTTDEKELIIQAQKGQIWAFEKLVRQYDRRVLNIAFQIVQNPQDAEDIYQEVWLKVHQQIQKFRSDSAFYTWLYRITVNTTISFAKNRRKGIHQSIEKGSISVASGDRQPDSDIQAEELRKKIQQGLDRLSMKQRVIFTLKYIEDFKIKDIAHIVSCSEGTVKNTLFRSTEKMRKALADYQAI